MKDAWIDNVYVKDIGINKTCMKSILADKTYIFYFELISFIFDIIVRYTKNIDFVNKIRYISKDKSFNPVTFYDKIIESNMIEVINLIIPCIDIYGEEFKCEPFSGNTWIIDPIDGTKSFLYGSPIWGTLITLIKYEYFIFGAVDHSYLKERLIAMDNKVLYKCKNKDYIILSKRFDIEQINKCVMCTSSFDSMNDLERAIFFFLSNNVKHTIYNYDCYAYTLLIKGHIDVIVECNLKPYDFIPLVPLLKASGCQICDWQGNDTCFDRKLIITRSDKVEQYILDLIKVKSMNKTSLPFEKYVELTIDNLKHYYGKTHILFKYCYKKIFPWK